MRRDIMPLTAERGAALIALERPQEALETYVLGLAALPPGAAAPSRAVLLRGEGAALTDLGRLDEAQIAYLRSLDLEPGHAGALGELAYIARMRAGAKPTATRLVITRDGGKPP
jgi:Flp pilus assembly protein TadD